MGSFILGFYLLCLVFFLLYSAFQLHIFISYRKLKKLQKDNVDMETQLLVFPKVTIQLPIFNELYVAKRLLDEVSKINYPADKLEIQVLDDSTDETVQVVAAKVAELKTKGVDIIHIVRTNREGFKAGALKAGLEIAKGEFITIFDSDFMPCPHFLYKTVAWFNRSEIGVVQTRWGHINRNFSLHTQLQAMALDAHFTMEQTVRDAKNYFLNFNGTAGVWRKSCILDAGNWEGDTLTEDLDLSYRAQLKGWKIKYLEDVVSPAELPVSMSAIRSQQFRWTKGGAQNFKHNYSRILKSNITKTQKLQALYHLFNSTTFLFVFIMALVSIPVMVLYGEQQINSSLKQMGLLFLSSTIILFVYYSSPYFGVEKGKKNIFTYFYHFFMFMIYMLGLSLNNTVAVIEAYMGIKSSFIRTPKFNISSESGHSFANKYIKKKISIMHILEALMAVVFFAALVYELQHEVYGFLYFHVAIFGGFAGITAMTIKEYFSKNL